MKKTISKTIKKFKDRCQERVRAHVSSERVCASCEVFLVIAWLVEHCPRA
ncbi:hypothetical protein [Streptomyces sp. NPDC048252]